MDRYVVIIGAGMLQVPLIKEARDLGLRVIATDRNSNADGATIADIFLHVDTSDAVRTATAVDTLSRDIAICGVTCAGIDAAPTVALCAERLGLPGLPYATACLTHNKALVRDAFDAAGLAHYQPRWLLAAGDFSTPLRARAIAEGTLNGWPVVVKPLEQSASRGVSIVYDEEGLATAVAKVLAYGEEYLIEEYLVGTEHSAELILDQGHVLFWNVVDRYFDYSSGTGIEIGHSNPSILPCLILNNFRQMALVVADVMGIQWGAFKLDLILSQGKAVILECTARLSGGWDSQWTSPATGRHPMRQLLQLACGLPVDVAPAPSGAAACAAILPQKAGLVTALPMRYTGAEVVWAIAPGATIAPATHNGARAGYVLAKAPTQAEAWACAKQAATELAEVVEAETEDIIPS